MKLVELPRLSNALRKFGNFSANYDHEDSRFQVYEIPLCNLSWDEFQILTRELCEQKNVNKVKQCCKKLLQIVGKIIGSEERVERKKGITVLLIAKLYKLEKILLKTVSEIKKDIVDQMNMEILQNFNEVFLELMNYCDPYILQEKLDEILDQQSSIFGEKIKFSCELPELPLITDFDFTNEDVENDSNNKDVVSSLSNLMDNHKNITQNDQTTKKVPPKPPSTFQIYDKMCANIQELVFVSFI